MSPLTYTITEAADRLGSAFTVAWLRKHINAIPHVRSGGGTGRAGRIGFTDAHLAEIVARYEIRPDGWASPTQPEDFAPLSRRRSA